MYESIKQATGPRPQTCGVLKTKDGEVITDKSKKLGRWIEHCSELYGSEGDPCLETISNLCQLPEHSNLDLEPTLEEITSVVLKLRNGKAAGAMRSPASCLKLVLNL